MENLRLVDGITEIETDTVLKTEKTDNGEKAYLTKEGSEVIEIVEDNKKYTSLQTAIADCGESEKTIKVLNDFYVVGQCEIGENQNIKIDLNDKNINSLDLINNGKLEFYDSSENKKGSILDNNTIINKNKLKISDITINNGSDPTIKNENTLEINSGEIKNQKATTIENINTGIVNFTGGTIISAISGIKNSGNGVLNIDGGTICIDNSAASNTKDIYGIQNIENGKINFKSGNITNKKFRNFLRCKSYGIYNSSSESIEFINGTINFDCYCNYSYGIYDTNSIDIYIGKTGDGLNTESPLIKAGDYGIYSPKGYLHFYDGIIKADDESCVYPGFAEIEDGYKVYEYKENSYQCVTLILQEEKVAEVENTLLNSKEEFYSFDKALKRCNELSGQSKITLLSDTIFYSTATINEEDNITIDLNEHKLNCSVIGEKSFLNNGIFTIENGTIESNKAGKDSKNYHSIIENNGKLILDNRVNIVDKGVDYIKIIQNNSTGDLKIIDGDLNYDLTRNVYNYHYGYAIYNDSGNVEVINGEINLSLYNGTLYAIYNTENGKVKITGGNIICTSSGSSGDIQALINNGYMEISGGTIQFDYNKDTSYAIINKSKETLGLKITGGTITGNYKSNKEYKGYGISNQSDSSNVEISGGTIDNCYIGISNEKATINYICGTIKNCYIGISNYYYYSNNRTIVIGKKDGVYDENSVQIIASDIAVEGGKIYFYDGVLKAETNFASDSCIFEEVEDEYEFYEETKKINGIEYKVTKLILLENKAVVQNDNLENEENFKYLSEAFTRANELEGTTIIKLLGDYNLYDSLNINENKNIILDLNSYKIRSLKYTASNNFRNKGTFIIKNGIISSNLRNYAMINNSANLTLENIDIIANEEYITVVENYYSSNCIVNFESGNILINKRGSYAFKNSSSDGIVNINGGIINIKKYDSTAIWNDGTVKFNDGNIIFNITDNFNGSNSYGIYNYRGNVEFNGGNIIIDKESKTRNYITGIYNNSSNSNVHIKSGKILSDFSENNETLPKDSYGVTNYGKIIVGEKGGKVDKESPEILGGTYGINNLKGTVEFYDGIIKGGVLSIYGENITTEDNYITKLFEDHNLFKCYVLTPAPRENAVALVDGIYYETLQTAINSCNNETEEYYISLVNGISEGEITINENQNIIIDLNGYSIRSSSENGTIINNGNLQIIDTSVEGTEAKVLNTKGPAIQNNGTELTIGKILENTEDGIIEISEFPTIDGATYGISNTNSSSILNFYGGKIIGGTDIIDSGTFNTPTGYITNTQRVDGKKEMTLKLSE